MARTQEEQRILTPAEFAAFGQPNRAESILQNILRKQPDNQDAAVELVRLHLFLGDYPAALEQIEKFRKQWPGEARLKSLEICAKKGQGRHEARCKRTGAETAVDVFTGEQTFHLVRFLFSIVVFSISIATFYYYIFYLDSTSSLAPRLKEHLLIIRDIVHLIYYILLIPAAALAFYGPSPPPQEPGLNPPGDLSRAKSTDSSLSLGGVGRYIPLAILLLLSFLSQGASFMFLRFIPPLPTALFHGGFYFLMSVILFFGIKNLIHFLFVPFLAAVRPDGLFVASRTGSTYFSWEEIERILLVEKPTPHPKEKHWTYQHWLQIETEDKSPLTNHFFLRRLSSSSLNRFSKMVDTLKKYKKVEQKTTQQLRRKSLFDKIIFP